MFHEFTTAVLSLCIVSLHTSRVWATPTHRQLNLSSDIITCSSEAITHPDQFVSVSIRTHQKGLGREFNTILGSLRRDLLSRNPPTADLAAPSYFALEQSLSSSKSYAQYLSACYLHLSFYESGTYLLRDHVEARRRSGINERCQFDESRPNRMVFYTRSRGSVPSIVESGHGEVSLVDMDVILSINPRSSEAFLCVGPYRSMDDDSTGSEYGHPTSALVLRCHEGS